MILVHGTSHISDERREGGDNINDIQTIQASKPRSRNGQFARSLVLAGGWFTHAPHIYIHKRRTRCTRGPRMERARRCVYGVDANVYTYECCVSH
jgi:hypothetical protein